MSKKVAVVAAAVTKFGFRNASYRDLISEAGQACLSSLEGALKPGDIDGFILSTVMPERTVFQGHVASLAEETLGIRPDRLSVRVEHMCASGNVALRTAYSAIVSGLAEVVMVLGVEKLNTPVPGETILNMGAGLDREWESSMGMTAPPVFALIAQYHMDQYGTTEEDLARVAVKNHTHSMNNPNAHFQKGATLEKVLTSRVISTPFKLLDCSPVSDGAAAIIVTSEERAKDFTAKPVYLLGTGQAVESFTLANLPDNLSHWPALVKAGKAAYNMAGIQPQDVDLAEVHDCFSIAELLAYEGLGWCDQGESAAFLKEGRSDYGGNVVVNPRGGLLACGHPLGATGVAQIAEIFWQLRDEAGLRQVKDAQIGLTHNNSGPGEHTVNIFGIEN